ncbi:hypothetical protein HY375_01190 [Candidatus Berkelbacteria bacterium]|nr:hypothetical protein [Candidatus Berkelbacteria bacterium]
MSGKFETGDFLGALGFLSLYASVIGIWAAVSGPISEEEIIHSRQLVERARIVEVLYQPESTDTDLIPRGFGGVPVGGGLAVECDTIPASYQVAVRTASGRMARSTDQAIYHQCDGRRGKSVLADYRAVLRVTYQDDKEVSRQFLGYEVVKISF